MSICVDRNSKEFKKLVQDLDIHPDNLELILYGFLNDESRNENPTKEEILQKLSPKPFKDSAENIEWYLKKEHDKPAVFLDKESALKEQALRDSFYGKGTSILYRNSKGEFVVKTGLAVDKELLEIRDEAIANGTYLLAPNGNPTNLNERQWLQVRTKNFINWFGDWINDPNNASKVVDENGEPMVVYHGQISPLNEFHPNTSTRFDKTNANGLKKMFYATPSITHAKQFSLDDTILLGQEIQKYLIEADATLKEAAELFNKTEEEIESILNTSNTIGKVYPIFLNIKNPIEIDAKNKPVYQLDKEEINAINNSEGAIVTNVFESLNPKYLEGLSFGDDILRNPFTTDYIVSNPNQIKSATSNTGEFSTQDDNIFNNKEFRGIYDVLSYIQKIKYSFKDPILGNVKKQIISKVGKTYYITKTDPEYAKQLLEIHRERLLLPKGIFKIETKGKNQVVTVDESVLEDLIERNNNSQAFGDLFSSAEEAEKVQDVLDFLSAKTGLNYQTISETEAAKLLKKRKGSIQNVNAFIHNNTCYFIQGRKLNVDIASEEMLHPFINAVYNRNPALFSNLLKEAKELFPRLNLEIAESYKNESQEVRKQELVTQALSRAFREERKDNPKGRKLASIIDKFWNFVKELFRAGNKDYILADEINSNTTIQDLAKIINTDLKLVYNSKFGKITRMNNYPSSINIYAGTGENAHLSNFAERPIEAVSIEDIQIPFKKEVDSDTYANILAESIKVDTFYSVEQAFQYAKTFLALLDIQNEVEESTRRERGATKEEVENTKNKLNNIRSIQTKIVNTTSGGALRSLGRSVPLSKDAIALWDKYKAETLKGLIKESFLQNEEAAKRLLATRDIPLTHKQDRGEYKTLFPKLLMEVREELREVFPQHDPLAVDAAYGNRDLFSDSSNDKLQITPTRSIDNKAKDKGSISNKFIGFGEEGSSTNAYRVQAGDKANTGDYNSQDTIFVSVPGKRGNAETRKQYQDKTIKEAIKAIEAGATLITDNIDYINNSDYNEGEKRLYQNLEHKGYHYETITVGNSKVGKWTKQSTQKKEVWPKNDPLSGILQEKLQELGIQIKEADLGEGISGKFVANEHTIYYNPNSIQDNTIVHEAIHAVSTYYLNITDQKSLPKNIKTAIKEINYCYDLLKDAYIKENFYENGRPKEGIDIEKAFNFWINNDQALYGLSSPSEMIAELTNPKFIEYIRKVDAKSKGKNIFQKLIDSILELFKTNKEYKNIEKTVKEALLELINNPNKQLLDNYTKERQTVKDNIKKIKESKHIVLEKIAGDAILEKLESLPEGTTEASIEITLDVNSVKNQWSMRFPEGTTKPLTGSNKGALMVYQGQLFASLDGSVITNNDDNTVTLPLKVYSLGALSTHELIVKDGNNGISYIESYTPIYNTNLSTAKVETFSGNWSRADVATQPDKVFLFGDNTNDRVNTHYVPRMTQAVIRGLPNAIGIDTKKNRGTAESSYFTDADFDTFKAQVDEAIQQAVNSGKTIVIPEGGIGTGKAQLQQRAPKLFNYLQEQLNKLQQGEITQKNTNEEYSLVESANKELLEVLGNDSNAQSEIKDVVKTVKKGISFEETLKGVDSIFTKEEIEQIKQGLNGKRLQVLSVSRQTDPAFFSKEIIKFLEENSKKSLSDPTRTNVIEIWSKHDGVPIQDILKACKKYKVAPMVSFSITGLGDTALEKGVLKYQDLIPLIGQLIESGDLNPQTTIIRIDPILVGETNMDDIKKIVQSCKDLGIKKFVTSLVQSYGYLDGTAKDRKVTSGINNALASEGRSYDWDKYYGKDSRGIINFKPKQQYIDEIGKELLELNKDPEIEIETCSFLIKGLKASACLDPLIIERITGISVTRPDGTYDRDTSRSDCMCYGAHSDMFRLNEKKCFSSCAYCYAGHSNDSNFKYYNEDGTLVDRPLTRVNPQASENEQSLEDNNIEELQKEFDKYSENIQEEQGKFQEIVTEENQAYMERMQRINQQLNDLNQSTVLSATEVWDVAEQMVFWISDFISRLQSEPGYAVKQFGKQHEGKDFSKMSRTEIANSIGIMNIIARCREEFKPRPGAYKNLKTIAKARQIYNNFEGILFRANPVFIAIEDFSIAVSKDGEFLEINTNINEDADNFNDSNSEYDVKELEGDLQLHWQVETKTRDVLDRMASPVKRMLRQCTLKDKDGNTVYSEFGVKRRIGLRDATNSILKWTQGAITLEDMTKKLSDKAEKHPWLNEIIEKLNDKSGKYTDLQSQFFGDFCKHFQSYYVVIEQPNGEFKSIPVNEEPALSSVYKQIESQYKAGEHTLFSLSGVNKTAFNELKSTLEDLKEFANEEVTDGNIQEISRLLGYASTVLGNTTTPELVSENLDTKGFKDMLKSLTYIVNNIEENLDNSNYTPFTFKSGGDIVSNLKDFLRPITQSLEDTTVASTHNNGKMYQSYITPSYTTKLFHKFSADNEAFEEFIEKEYGVVPFFKNPSNNKWRNEWIKEMIKNPESRGIFKHKVQLNFNKRNYMKDMNDMEYTVSIITEYFAESHKGKGGEVPAWFRVPMLSNKPSSEFIRFISYRGPGYKDILTGKFYSIFRQELDRIQTVMTRNLDKTDPDYIENFDKNGKKFVFLEFLNDYLPGNKKSDTELGKLIKNYLEGKDINEMSLNTESKKVIKDAMETRAQSIVDDWETQGITKATKKISGAGKSKEDIRENLINFVWNDTFAAMNIMQLTITDPAYYKHAEDLQKRLAQIHAPGIRGLSEPVDYKGKPVTDGKFRTIKLTDFKDVISNVIDNITEVFDRKIANAPKSERAALEALKESLVGEEGAFRKINVADAQGYSSPTSYRKKAFRFGKWSKESEEIWEKLKDGEYTYNDLKVAFQPLKPFVYSQVIKETGVSGAVYDKIKVPVQFKNSEYLLIMADAILQGEETSKPNLLRAIYEVMEESHFDEKTGEYKTDGIDTVQFESTTKSGLSGAISVNDLVDKEYGEVVAINRIKSAIYKEDGSYSNAVDVIAEEDYCLQQEVPEHFKNHHQVHGSQGRYIIPSELESVNPDGTPVTYTIVDPKSKDGVRTVTAKEFKEEYENIIAENIQDSIDTLVKELYLDGLSVKNRNIALSRILQKEILSSPRYGIDLLQACSVDEDGRFRIPLGDPVQSKRVEQLLNSIVKNRINKQEIAGGPVVQVSNFGTSKQLNIRFKDKVTGEILKSKEEWEKNKTKHSSYEEYKAEHQGGIAYFECFAPIYANEIFSKFADKDGNIDIQTIEDIDPELLKMVGYRIPTEDKYSMAPLKIVGFLPREAGDGIMLPYEITTLSGSDFDVDKMYLMIKEIMISARNTKFNKLEGETLEESEEKYIAKHKQQVVDHIVEDLKSKGIFSQEKITEIDDEIEGNYKLREMAEKRRHEQALKDIESRFAHMDELNEKALEEASKDSTKDYLDKKSDRIDRDYDRAIAAENKKHENRLTKLKQSKERAVYNKIVRNFLSSSKKDNSNYDDDLMRAIRRSYYRYMYHTVYPTSGREYRNNKIVDMTYEVLTHETSADKVLNPGGFDPQKKMGYMVSVYRNSDEYTWEQLEAMSINELKDLSNADKNLCYINTHVQFYKQNAAAGSLIGSFAVHRTAHAVLESGTDDGSAEYKVNVNKACKIDKHFTILGMEFGGNMPFDMRYDRNGQLIGKVLGSLVASSADAVKDPVLNLMNINGNTANILTALVRLGMPFEDAALFISQSAITDILSTYSRENITSHKSFIKVINDRLEELRKEHKIGKGSEINTEELTREELIKGLKFGVDPKTEYKVLLALSNISKISKAMRLPTFATRFNSSSGSPGPLMIDNLITEYTMEDLDENSCIIDQHGNLISMQEIFDKHPILNGFKEAIYIANKLLKDVPANSRGFRNILDRIKGEPILNTLLREKKLLGYLSDFYQSYLLMQSGVIDENDLNYYISEFPREFKNSNIKEKYKDNLLIQAIKYTVDKNDRLVLSVDTTGLDTQAKEKLSAAWIDLHKKDPELSIKLFKYNFFKGGIGYNPKTFMNLLPTQIKEKIPGYIDTYRMLPATSSALVFDQFIRNNWNEDRLVPRKKSITFKHLEDGTLMIDRQSEVDGLYGASYFKVKSGNEDKLYKILERIENRYGSQIICEEIKPLGSNKDYIEMSSEHKNNPLHIPSEALIVEDADSTGKDSDISSVTTDDFHDEADSAVNEKADLEKLLYDILIVEGKRDRAGAENKLTEFGNKSQAEQSSLKVPMKKFFETRLKKLGIEFNEQLLEDLYKLMCN